jgi:hypothetical protein
MAKKFTVALINDTYQVFLPGFVEIEELSDSLEIVDILSEYSSFEKVSFLVEHSLFNDFPNQKNIDISDKDIVLLMDNYEYLLNEGYISIEEVAEFEIYGIKDDVEYVDYSE